MDNLTSWTQFFFDSLKTIGDKIVEVLPSIFGAILFLLLGWLLARIVSAAIVRLLHELPQRNGKAVWMSLACQNGRQLNDGSRLEDVLETLRSMDPGADLVNAVGINCCDIRHGE